MKNFKFLLLTMVAAGALVACDKAEKTPVVEIPVTEDSLTVEETPANEEAESDSSTVQVEGQLLDAFNAVVEVYGDSYNAPMDIDIELLEAIYGVNPEHISQFFAKQAMISLHVDQFIGIEATEGNVDAVEAALNDYRDYLVSDSMQYPMNIEKVQASKVLKYDNMVFFVLLGEIYDQAKHGDVSPVEFVEAEVQKAVDALDSVLAQ